MLPTVRPRTVWRPRSAGTSASTPVGTLEPKAGQPAKPKAEWKAKGGQTWRHSPPRARPARARRPGKTTGPKDAPKGKTTAKAREGREAPAAPREGSKTAQVVAMLQRKGGATDLRDHEDHGLAAAYRAWVHGRRDEEGRLILSSPSSPTKASARTASASRPQTAAPFRPLSSGRGGRLSCRSL